MEQWEENKLDDHDALHHLHESFMVNLCRILDLEYEQASERDVLDAIQKLKVSKMLDNASKKA